MKRNYKIWASVLCVVICLLSTSVFAQLTLAVDSINCGATSTTIHSSMVGETPTSSGITTDDTWSPGVIPIGFSFNFYGTSYTKCVIGGNGAICFDTTLAGGSFGWVISAVLLGNSTVTNCVCGPWCDIYVPAGGTITYATVGTAPYRKFVVDFCHDAMFSCTTQWTTSQIILYETTNLAEVHIAHKTVCSTWNGGYAIVGVQNAAGTAATAAPSRDYPTVWTATNEAWQFTPNTGYTAYSVAAIAFAPVPFASSPVYWFDSSTGAYLGTGPTLGVSPTAPTTYIAASEGCDDTSYAFIHVDMSTLVSGGSGTGVTAGFTLEAHPGCVADTVFCFNNSIPSGNTSIWSYGDGSPLDSSMTNPRHVYAVQGTYNVTLLYHNAAGCKDTMTLSVNFNHPISSVFTASANSVCLGSPVTFTNTSVGNGATYLWSFGDGTTATDMNPTHAYLAGGNYTVQLTVTDTIPCFISSNTNIQVVSINVVAAPHDTTVCLRQPMEIFATADINPKSVTSITYAWTPAGNLDDATKQNPYFSGVGDFVYTVTATVSPLGCTASDVVTIHSKPPITLTNITASQTIAIGKSIQLNSMGAYIYTWTPNNGTLNNPNINNPVATPTDSVTTYRVIGSSLYGCKDTAYITIHVDEATPDAIPSAFTPNNDGINDVFRVFGITYQKLVEMRIYNRWGHEVFQTTDPRKGWDGTLDGVPQDMGVYNYQILLAYPDGHQKAISGTVTLIR